MIRWVAAETSDDYLPVATTRPETVLGDTAVAVHPEVSSHCTDQFFSLVCSGSFVW